MSKKKLWTLAVVFMLGLSLFVISGCSSDQAPVVSERNAIPEGETDPAVWGQLYPNQYDSYKKNAESTEKPSHFNEQPLLTELFKGYGFAIEYNHTRGHVYALDDVRSIKRINSKSTASCLTCKSAEVPALIKEMGVDYYSTSFEELSPKTKHPISCSDCHDSQTMNLKITREPFIKAMDRRGIDVTKATRQEMRSYVCAQCHVEYYFDPTTKEVIFPWDKGFSPDEIEEYFTEIGFSDWEHPDSKSKMIKAQHPEFETWQSGTHGSAGVSCADCHMPYQKVGSKKATSHLWNSPMKSMEQSCTACHRQGTDWLKERVEYTQGKSDKMLLEAQEASLAAHKAVEKALATPGADQESIKKAQELITKGQWRWDFVSAENSSGFHNPALSLETLGKSIDYSRQAQVLAEQAISKAKK